MVLESGKVTVPVNVGLALGAYVEAALEVVKYVDAAVVDFK
jgi:hypothetical protein